MALRQIGRALSGVTLTPFPTPISAPRAMVAAITVRPMARSAARPPAAAADSSEVARAASLAEQKKHGFMTDAITRAKKTAMLKGRRDPTEGKPRMWYAKIRNNDTSVWKLNLVAKLVRGMSVDNAITQMKFSPKKAAKFVLRGIYQARSNAIKEGIDDPSKMYVSESYPTKGHNTKGIRFHGRGRTGRVVHPKTHYFCILAEGRPEVTGHRRQTRAEWEAEQQQKFW
eukprot:CAMPEP_0182926714 /NCGR_PEP_ID=MMETSP0105_2-20130417/12225_1 /TAXON_ID=81532 ORGANISM="Acanthoeca-like sp., Strain 10tr" /NCGR_SAMPLE_ID=MMETSP0105_2 /ASSEMBLY_ACC=CAM_ASM_000205 /LENGTH=227 /DNA_ID=CAMNT_0025064617 /DNA_START=21 /DNA_END=701 /DNA_ORIENTATION=-